MTGWALLIILVVYLLDWLARWMENRGWIYYRKSGGTFTRMGNAFLGMQSMFEPGKKHMMVAKQGEKRKKEEAGDPPFMGDDGPSQPRTKFYCRDYTASNYEVQKGRN